MGGFWTGFFAILSDALHDLRDSVSLGLAWYFQRLSGKERNEQFTLGYKRFNTLGALITGVMLAGEPHHRAGGAGRIGLRRY